MKKSYQEHTLFEITKWVETLMPYQRFLPIDPKNESLGFGVLEKK